MTDRKYKKYHTCGMRRMFLGLARGVRAYILWSFVGMMTLDRIQGRRRGVGEHDCWPYCQTLATKDVVGGSILFFSLFCFHLSRYRAVDLL
jgi:hypothetical protein